MKQFFSQFPVIIIPKNQIFISPDDDITTIYYLERGKVRMFAESPEGEEITVHVFNEQSYIPIMFALTSKKSNYYFQAMSDIVAKKAPVEEVINYLKTNPGEIFELATKFSFAIGGLTKRIETLAFEDAYHKVLHLLQYFAQKYGATIPLTHEEIASWLGLKRETVSRQIEKLQQEGIVQYQKNTLVVTKITE